MDKPNAEQIRQIIADLTAWEIREARVYREILTPEQAAKVRAGLGVAQ
jgi:hypothetical protein